MVYVLLFYWLWPYNDITDHKTLYLKCYMKLEPCKTTYAIILNEHVIIIFLNTLSVIVSANGKVSKNS